MLYYFNFVQTEYFKEAEADVKKDMAACSAHCGGSVSDGDISLVCICFQAWRFSNSDLAPIWVGALAGTFMFLNVWLIIWPNQQVVLGMKLGDGPSSAAKAGR